MGKKEFKLAIVMPVKDGEAHILSALDSIIKQSFCGKALLFILDVNSKDFTSVLCEKFKQKYAEHSNLTIMLSSTRKIVSPSIARNFALKQVVNSAELVTFLDHDDCWPENRIITDMHLFQQNKQYDVVVGKTKLMPSSVSREHDYRFQADSLHNVNLGAATFKAEVFTKLGLFDENLVFSEDHDYFFRMREENVNLYFADKLSLYYRLHMTNMTRNKTAEELALLKVLRKSLLRRDKKSLPAFGKNS